MPVDIHARRCRCGGRSSLGPLVRWAWRGGASARARAMEARGRRSRSSGARSERRAKGRSLNIHILVRQWMSERHSLKSLEGRGPDPARLSDGPRGGRRASVVEIDSHNCSLNHGGVQILEPVTAVVAGSPIDRRNRLDQGGGVGEARDRAEIPQRGTHHRS